MRNKTTPEISSAPTRLKANVIRSTYFFLIIAGLVISLYAVSAENAWCFPSSLLYFSLTAMRSNEFNSFIFSFILIACYCAAVFVRYVILCLIDKNDIRKNTIQSMICAGIALLSILSFIFGDIITSPLKKTSTLNFASRGDQIVAALEKYKATHGEYPDELGILVPEYLKSIPSTGIYCDSHFRYEKYKTKPAHHAEQHNDYFLGVKHMEYMNEKQIRYIKDITMTHEILKLISSREITRNWIEIDIDSF